MRKRMSCESGEITDSNRKFKKNAEWQVVLRNDDGEESPVAFCLTKQKAYQISKLLSVEPLYSSVISDPHLNNPSKSCRECADFFEGVNDIPIVDLLYAIESLHCSGRYLGHPHIELHSDGSGRVVGRYQDGLWSFRNLKDFYEKACKDYDEMESKPQETEES